VYLQVRSVGLSFLPLPL